MKSNCIQSASSCAAFLIIAHNSSIRGFFSELFPHSGTAKIAVFSDLRHFFRFAAAFRLFETPKMPTDVSPPARSRPTKLRLRASSRQGVFHCTTRPKKLQREIFGGKRADASRPNRKKTDPRRFPLKILIAMLSPNKKTVVQKRRCSPMSFLDACSFEIEIFRFWLSEKRRRRRKRRPSIFTTPKRKRSRGAAAERTPVGTSRICSCAALQALEIDPLCLRTCALLRNKYGSFGLFDRSASALRAIREREGTHTAWYAPRR